MPHVRPFESHALALVTRGKLQTFMFDPIDLYDKKNIPKVIFCIHVLRFAQSWGKTRLVEADTWLSSHLLAKQGLAERIGDLLGQLDFSGTPAVNSAREGPDVRQEEELAKTQKGLRGVAMPNFGDVGRALAKEASWEEPDEPEETEAESGLRCRPSGNW